MCRLAMLSVDTLWYLGLVGVPMPTRWNHRVVVLLLLLFAVDAGAVMAAGAHHCDDRCGCCEPSRHGVGAVGAPHPMGSGAPPMGAHPAEGACCQPASVSGCDAAHVASPALVSGTSPQRPICGADLRTGVVAPTADGPSGGHRRAAPPSAAAPEALTAVPIYLRIAAFLC